MGIVGGDWLHHIRIRNAERLARRTEEILEHRKITGDTKIALPLLYAVQDETREELRELWARMLANEMDPARAGSVRKTVIEVVKHFEPLDIVVMEKSYILPPYQEKFRNVFHFPNELGISPDEFEVSIKNLSELGCIETGSKKDHAGTPITEHIAFTHFGRETLRACSL